MHGVKKQREEELRERFVIPLPVINLKMLYHFLRIIFK